STANVVATLSGPMASDLNFTWYTTDGTAKSPGDYTRVFLTSARIPAGATSTTLPVTIVGNTTVEGDKTFTVNATNVFIPPCCAPPPQLTTADLAARATVTILNDDVGLVPANQNVAKGHDATILLLLGAGSNAPETIGLASSDSNVAKVPSVLYLAAGQ